MYHDLLSLKYYILFVLNFLILLKFLTCYLKSKILFENISIKFSKISCSKENIVKFSRDYFEF